jgi:hypothetical protein
MHRLTSSQQIRSECKDDFVASDPWDYLLFHNDKISDVQVATGLKTLNEKTTFLAYAIMLPLDFLSTCDLGVIKFAWSNVKVLLYPKMWEYFLETIHMN